MNRVIKFRAWDGRTGKWYASYNGPFVWALEGEWNGGEAPSETVSQLPEGIELMQFTGLLDKNGEEIYEGDVVENTAKVSWAVEFNPDKAAWHYFRPENSLDDIRRTTFGLTHSSASKMKVIGNIYENKDLLA